TVLSACSTPKTPSESQTPLVVPVTAPSENNEQTEENSPQPPEEAEVVLVSYNPKGRRDPFRSIVSSRSGSRRPTVVGSLPPLQRRDISNLKLIGIIWGDFAPNAIITAPGGKGYTVRVGTRIGLNNGVIKRITQNEVVVEETLVNIFGEAEKSDVTMELHPQKEGLE
ncbi:pilus assembly protein PilP, partial [Nitrospira defluvii]|nr:pilus assembly protein PilP [Nitrospira defluvii]